MPGISDNNNKRIRDALDVHCGITSLLDLTGDITLPPGYKDVNVNAALNSDTWKMQELADLKKDGFSLSAGAVFWDDLAQASASHGKIGYRSNIGESFQIVVKYTQAVPAITVNILNGFGTITCSGKQYSIRKSVVIPLNATSATLIFNNADEEDRIEIASIIPGISIAFDSSNLISCTATLRSDLSIESPSWQTSEIEVKAHYPDDISEAISNMSDNAPIWYYSGIDGEYTDTREFYLSEPSTMEEGIITLKGVDASHKLQDKSNISQVLSSTANNGRAILYDKFKSYITGAGIKLRNIEQPPASSKGGTEYTMVLQDASSSDMISDLMNLTHQGSYWLRFVDGGIPSISWSKPTAKWDIKEEDCGSVQRAAARNIAQIDTDDEYGLQTKVTKSNTLKTIETTSVTAGQRYSQNLDGYWWYLTVSNAKNVFITAQSILYNAVKSTTTKKNVNYNQCVVKGKPVSIASEGKTITPDVKRQGATVTMSPKVYGKAYGGSVMIYPNYKALFDRSNITGSFTWKGDPRMQPRDVFTFKRLDGSVETCTISEITFKHEGGGLTAEIEYRKGIC